MEVNLVTWIITIVVLLGFIAFDFYSHVKSPHEPSMKEAGGWMAFYMSLAGLFTIFLWFIWTHEHALEFFNGYITELSLSIDNLFIFALIIGSFKIPRAYQQKVLLIGIALALAMRLIFILLGAAAINAWSWVFYIFGAFLLYTAVKLVVDEVKGEEDTNIDDMFGQDRPQGDSCFFSFPWRSPVHRGKWQEDGHSLNAGAHLHRLY